MEFWKQILEEIDVLSPTGRNKLRLMGVSEKSISALFAERYGYNHNKSGITFPIEVIEINLKS